MIQEKVTRSPFLNLKVFFSFKKTVQSVVELYVWEQFMPDRLETLAPSWDIQILAKFSDEYLQTFDQD